MVRAQSGLLVIASGLDNPRGLAFGPDGGLYVAEAGRGGTSTACAPAPDPPFPNRCYGPSGAITRILAVGDQRRVVVGLPSIAPASGANAQGPVDIDFGLGAAWVTTGFGGNPALRAPLEAVGAQMGRLVRINSIGQPETLLDLSAHEAANNPDGGAIDSNPFGLNIVANGAYYADAGGNAVMRIGLTGAISTVAVFPNRQPFPGSPTVQAVPTSVAVAPNGDIFVGELTGAPFLVGAARVYRIPAAGGTPKSSPRLHQHHRHRARAGRPWLRAGTRRKRHHRAWGRRPVDSPERQRDATVLASTGLIKPGGVAIGPDDAAYVTMFANSPGMGQVVRITQ